MSDYGPGSMTGGVSPEGQTTPVGVSGRLSKKDRMVLCQVLCKCKKIGVATRNGRIQRQRCVQQRLDFANEISQMETGAPTEYKPEQTYNMKAVPPEPVTDPDDPLRPHSDIRQWINDYWPGGRKKYKAGQGNLRRPDVVVVNDPTQPPVQANIKMVVEYKFPPDDFSRDQRQDYIEIAGSQSKFVRLGPAECGCGDDDQNGQESTQRQSKSSTSDLDDLAGQSGGNGGSSLPGGGSLPLPPPGRLPPGILP
ncbi:VRR-NUC domain-containing protein [Burkholderia pseudomallei]|uniref:VRR-NUC domain-containing protein n=1 Tax=Burkholderia pseudomallei TaxID=28450 RepID=UPI001AAFB365|nr:VRR-NUC domain-containing protein [Burkholderia pseudomallei]MBO2962250.1 VRR-NUC domain-containing protein [Burkholderia pseudomallei]MBO7788230.1 VRR-NUC domain-containing protein [Burkholderia pseudomallei]MBO7841637.1 VRR-NUC domain-containing protein [Burkholderia pseudomallei]